MSSPAEMIDFPMASQTGNSFLTPAANPAKIFIKLTISKETKM
jgi:hypothetical protein